MPAAAEVKRWPTLAFCGRAGDNSRPGRRVGYWTVDAGVGGGGTIGHVPNPLRPAIMHWGFTIVIGRRRMINVRVRKNIRT